jgi:hypothetical protein
MVSQLRYFANLRQHFDGNVISIQTVRELEHEQTVIDDREFSPYAEEQEAMRHAQKIAAADNKRLESGAFNPGKAVISRKVKIEVSSTPADDAPFAAREERRRQRRGE